MPPSLSRSARGLILVLSLAAVAMGAEGEAIAPSAATDPQSASPPAVAPPTIAAPAGTVICFVQNVTPDGLYVNAGRKQGLRQGDEGVVRQDGVDIARVEVVQVTFASAVLRIVTTLGADATPLPGDVVEIALSRGEPGERGESTLRTGEEEDPDGFRPLLAPPRPTTATPPANLTHGRIRLRETVQMDDDSDYDYSRALLGSSGTVERIDGTPWTLRWSGDFEYLHGDSLSIDGEDGFDVDWRELVVERPLLDGSSLTLGRSIPQNLPAVGYLDGAQFDRVLDPVFRIGAIAGLKPDREDLSLSAKEPVIVGYGTVVSSEDLPLSYYGTAGVLFSLYEGTPDRLAFLVDHRARYRESSIYQLAEVDLDIGGAEEKSGVNLTRFNTQLDVPIGYGTTLRGSVDHYERPDTAAERDFLPDVDLDELFDSGSWRYALGAAQRLGRRARLEGEVAKLTGSEVDDDLRWRARGTWIGLPGSELGQISLSAFHLVGGGTDGIGARLTLFVPLWEDRVRVRPSLGVRAGEETTTQDEFDFTDYSLAIDGTIGEAWDWSIAYNRTLGEGTEASSLFAALTWRW